MRIIIKSSEYYGVSPNYINRGLANKQEEEEILRVFMKYDEKAEVYHKELKNSPKLMGTVRERYNQLGVRKLKISRK